MIRSWRDVPISLLSDSYRFVLVGCYAQCQSCGRVFTDDVPIVDAALHCPSCLAIPLKRMLSLDQLRPHSDFPETFKE